MIFGSFTSDNKYVSISEAQALKSLITSRGLDCIEVSTNHFLGGYYQNPELPYKKEDVLFIEKQKDIIVLLSGSVYNNNELLKKEGLSLNLTDPEMIARLFLNKGADFVKELNGDFAIFICKPSESKSYLYRDHVGINPLAYTLTDHGFSFSSDITDLCKVYHSSGQIDSDYLLGYFKYVDYRKTPNKRVKKLEPGHYFEYSDEGLNFKQYWKPQEIKINKSLGYNQMISEVEHLLRDAVRIRCDDRFFAGAHVSSGLDSGIVSALARKEYSNQKEFYGFSWSPESFDPETISFDEREIVRSACKKAGLNPVFSSMGLEKFTSFVNKPNDNIGHFSEEMVLDQAGELDTNLIFSGWGGDEFISMMDRGIDSDLFFGLNWRLFFKKNPPWYIKRFTRNMFNYIILPAIGILDFATRRAFRDDTRYIKKSYKRSDKKAIRNFYFYKSRRQLHLGLLRFYHINQRTENWAINGFRKGVEYRYPLLDKRILEYVLSVPSKLLCGSGYRRIILREIGEGIIAEEVRWHWQKNDPVFFASEKLFTEKYAIPLMKEVEEWKALPEFFFIDFDLLEKDIGACRNNMTEGDYSNLFGTLVYTKMLYEFVKNYKESA